MTSDRSGAAATTSRRWVLGLTATASLMAMLDAMVVSTSLGTIRRSLGASLETVQWTLNAYNLSFGVLLLLGAALGDRFGRRKMFTLGTLIFVLGSIGCAASPTIEALVAARVFQGAGAALIVPLSMALLAATYRPDERAWALGMFSSITGSFASRAQASHGIGHALAFASALAVAALLVSLGLPRRHSGR